MTPDTSTETDTAPAHKKVWERPIMVEMTGSETAGGVMANTFEAVGDPSYFPTS